MGKNRNEKKKNYWNGKTGKYLNQESFIIDKRINKEDPDNKWLELEKDALWIAIKDLTPSELIFYLYVMSNKNKTEWNFSPQDMMNKTGLSERSIRNAKHGLKKKGYWDEEYGIFHQYKDSGKTFREDPAKLAEDTGNICRTNNISSTKMTKDNMETCSQDAGSFLNHPKEEEFIF